ncbi:MAG TPA: organic hydroperoxide resistance protein [Pilimelia sp.]|nr:organic hydroperoxide resistance protein [Pilimelia sp.]
MLQSVLYTASATAHGGRDGRVITSDGQLDLSVATPKELGGPGEATNPEQLFAAGFAACFHSALQVVGRRARLDTTGSTVTAQVDLGRATDNPGYGLQVDLVVALPALDVESARQLVAKADSVCPYSNATRGNIAVTHEVLAAN